MASLVHFSIERLVMTMFLLYPETERLVLSRRAALEPG